jgi:hypothetical protein
MLHYIMIAIIILFILYFVFNMSEDYIGIPGTPETYPPRKLETPSVVDRIKQLVAQPKATVIPIFKSQPIANSQSIKTCDPVYAILFEQPNFTGRRQLVFPNGELTNINVPVKSIKLTSDWGTFARAHPIIPSISPNKILPQITPIVTNQILPQIKPVVVNHTLPPVVIPSGGPATTKPSWWPEWLYPGVVYDISKFPPELGSCTTNAPPCYTSVSGPNPNQATAKWW